MTSQETFSEFLNFNPYGLKDHYKLGLFVKFQYNSLKIQVDMAI